MRGRPVRLLVASAAAVLLASVATPARAAEGVLPVAGPVARQFDPPDQPWLAGHRGVDLLVSAGTPVGAAMAGRIGFAGLVAGKPVVTVIHGSLRTTYEPVTATRTVGEPVGRGETIGILQEGHSCAGGSCLHWGLKEGDVYLDPMLLVTRPEVRLLSEEAAALARERAAGR